MNIEVSTVLYRHLEGGNIKKAAHLCDVKEQTVYAWCKGQNRVPDFQLIRLMREFPAIAQDLLGPDLLVVVSAPTPFCGLQTNRVMTDAQAELGVALEDGVIDHTERPRVRNKFYRVMQHLHRQLPGLA